MKQGRWSDNWFNNIPAVFFFIDLFILQNKLSISVPPPLVNLVGRVMCGNRICDVRRSKNSQHISLSFILRRFKL